MKKLNWKLVSVVLAVCLGVSVVYSAFAQAWTIPDIYMDDLPASATYTIKTDGTYYWAVRYDGKVSWTSTNCSYIVNSCYAALPEGGKIVMAPYDGYYYLTSPVVSNSKSVLLCGESISYKDGFGQSTVFMAANYMEFMFHMDGQWSSFEKIAVHGNSTGSGGIKLDGIDSYVDRCFLLHCNNATNAAINLASTNHWVSNCWIEWNALGINTVQNSYIYDNHFVENTQDIASVSYNVKITNNLFRSSSTRSLNLWSASSDTIVMGNIFEATTAINEFIIFSQTANNTIISNNIVKGNALAAYFIRLYNNAVLNGIIITDNNIRTLGTAFIQYGTGLTGNVTAYNNMVADVLVP